MAPSSTDSTDSRMKGQTSTAKQGLVDAFNSLSTSQALGIVIGLAALMIAYIYRDFLFGSSVLLYTDIGSDAVNVFYQVWCQQAKLWSEYDTLDGFSLETVMGMKTLVAPYDPFTWIIIGGGPSAIPQNLVYSEIAKSVVIVLAGFAAMRLMGFTNLTALLGSISLGFSGYVALGATGWYVHSTEVVLITVALWATEYALNGKSFWYVLAPLAFAWVTQLAGYLIIYLTAALFVYVVLRTLTMDSANDRFRRLASALASLAIGLLISYSAIETMVELLTDSGRAEALKIVEGGSLSIKKDRPLTQLVDRIELMNVVQRAYSTNALGVGNDFKGMSNFLEAPLLYMGLPMLLFFPLYGIGLSRRDKIVWGAMLAAVLMMLIFPWFRYAFWGFKLDYFREFTMLIGVFLLLLAMRGFDGMVTGRSDRFRIWLPVAMVVMLLLPFVFAKPPGAIDASQRTMSVLLLLGIGGSAIAAITTRRADIILGVVALGCVDLSINAHSTITERSLLTTADIRNGKLYGDASVQALEWIKSQDGNLHRVVKYAPSGPAIHASLNDAMVQGFNGLIGYASFHNRYYLKFMSELGCSNLNIPDESKWVSRIITRPFLASFLGAKYFITKGAPLGFQPEIFPVVHRVQDQFIQRSSVAMPLMIAYDRYITPDQFRQLPSARQEYILFKAVVLEPEDASRLGIAPYDLARDTVVNVTPADFLRAAEERRAFMNVSARTTVDGVDADIDLRAPSVVVTSIPFDPKLGVEIDGKIVEQAIGNFGFIAKSCPAGRHKVSVTYDFN